MRWAGSLVTAGLIAAGCSPSAEPLRIGAASDLRFALPELITAYQQQTPGTEIDVSYAASGTLAAQVVNGAPFDIFLSADRGYVDFVATQIGERPQFCYATGSLIVAATDPSLLPPEESLEVILTRGEGKIAIANPEHAPYGRAAQQALETFGIFEQVRDRLVFGENVAQAADFVQSGNASLGLISRSYAGNMTTYRDLPPSLYAPLLQCGMRITETDDGADFVEFLSQPAARDVFEAFGFQPADASMELESR